MVSAGFYYSLDSKQMKYLKMLMDSRPFTESIPDQSTIIDNPEGAIRMQALRGSDYLYIYSPYGLAVKSGDIS
jgi:hypothetical protein